MREALLVLDDCWEAKHAKYLRRLPIRRTKHAPDAAACLRRAFAEQHDADVLLKVAHSYRKVGAFPREVVARHRRAAVAQLAREAKAAEAERDARTRARERSALAAADDGEEEAPSGASVGEEKKKKKKKKKKNDKKR